MSDTANSQQIDHYFDLLNGLNIKLMGKQKK